MKYDLIIIGSGSVGAAAGYYATRAGLIKRAKSFDTVLNFF